MVGDEITREFKVPGTGPCFVGILPFDQQYFQLVGAESEDNTIHRDMWIDGSGHGVHAAKIGNKKIKSKVNVRNTLTMDGQEGKR
jgi:hypothetical protein